MLIDIILQFLYSRPLPPITGNIPDNTICPVQSVPTSCTNNGRRSFLLGIVRSHIHKNSHSRASTYVLSYLFCYILYFAPDRHTVMSSPSFTTLPTFRIIESPINIRVFLTFPSSFLSRHSFTVLLLYTLRPSIHHLVLCFTVSPTSLLLYFLVILYRLTT